MRSHPINNRIATLIPKSSILVKPVNVSVSCSLQFKQKVERTNVLEDQTISPLCRVQRGLVAINKSNPTTGNNVYLASRSARMSHGYQREHDERMHLLLAQCRRYCYQPRYCHWICAQYIIRQLKAAALQEIPGKLVLEYHLRLHSERLQCLLHWQTQGMHSVHSSG